uniref:Protein krueppel n=1 Tax=Glossina brevipalpis TaxID=37001 RepID=A0A1A9WIG6_9MUSC
MDRKKVLELDKICRVCICERKDMRPLFSEKVAEMLMECASVNVEQTEGWPDKICVQCVHSVSRCHAFKMLAERSDKELREYIKSLTVRVLIDDAPEVRIQQGLILNEVPGLKLQPQAQQVLLQTTQDQSSIKVPHQKQQKLLQKQVKQQKQQEKQQQQINQQKQQQSPITQKKKISRKKQQQQHQQQQQQQTQIHQQQPPPPIQPQQILQQHTMSIAEPVTLHASPRLPPPPPLLSTAPQLLPITSNHSTTTNSTIVPATSAHLPQQILLPNGQIITTAQIVTTNGGAPQLTQIITNPNPPPPQAQAVAQPAPQFAPQLIQTTGGQTLQLIQQPNGQHVLQFVQLVPQRLSATGTNCSTAIIDDEQITMVDEETLMEQSEQHLIDDDDLEEVQADDSGAHMGSRDQICETIVVEDDQLQVHHQQLLGHNDSQEMEYLEDITVTTTQQQRHHHLVLHQQEHILPNKVEDVDEEDDDDIIEQVEFEEEMLDDDEDADTVLLDASNAEFITDQDNDHEMIDENTGDGSVDNVTLTHYTVVAENDDEVLVEAEVNAVLQAACGQQLQKTENNNLPQTVSVTQIMNNNNNVGVTAPKKQKRTSNAKTLINSRQLAATASSIAAAAAGDEDFEIDEKLIAEFINQQTTVVGSGRYMCNLCRQEFRQFKGLQNHMHSHSNWIRANCKKLPQCEICQKSFKGPGMLKMHMKTHQSAAKTPTCQICEKTFKTKAILYRHRQIHQQRWFLCAVENCRKGFSSPLSLKAHIDRKHPEPTDTGKFKCGECSMVFYNVNDLNDHVHQTGHGLVAATSPNSNNKLDHHQSNVNNANLSVITSSNLTISNNNNVTTATTAVTMAEVVNSNGEVFIVTPA